jgi:hypothetical protein
LPEEVARGGFGGLKLEREMHAFVAAILHRCRITTHGRTSLVRAARRRAFCHFRIVVPGLSQA